MTADVDERPHNSRGVAPHDERIFGDVGRAEITRLGNLALVAQIHPAAREHLAAFLLVDLRIDVNRATDESPIGVHQRIDVGVGEHHSVARLRALPASRPTLHPHSREIKLARLTDKLCVISGFTCVKAVRS